MLFLYALELQADCTIQLWPIQVEFEFLLVPMEIFWGQFNQYFVFSWRQAKCRLQQMSSDFKEWLWPLPNFAPSSRVEMNLSKIVPYSLCWVVHWKAALLKVELASCSNSYTWIIHALNLTQSSHCTEWNTSAQYDLAQQDLCHMLILI